MARVNTSTDKAAHRRLRETAERPYFLRKVISNPIPRKIMMCTSAYTKHNQMCKSLKFNSWKCSFNLDNDGKQNQHTSSYLDKCL